MAEEKSTLLADDTQKRWTKTDLVLLAVCLLVSFGDGIEVYLPGIRKGRWWASSFASSYTFQFCLASGKDISIASN